MGKASRKKSKLSREVPSGERRPGFSRSGSPQKPGIGTFLQKPLAAIVLIMVFGFFAYSNTFHSPFQWDEVSQLLNNPVIKDLRNFTSGGRGYDYNPRRYIGYLTFALNYHFGGFDVIGYHIVNLLIHIANALLVYFLVLLTFRTPSLRQSSDSSPPVPAWIALFSALLFVSHPVQTEAVTYVIQRFASLATFFYLLSVVMYVKGRLAGEKQGNTEGRLFSGPSLLFYLASLISVVCAMKTKEIAFTLPFVIVLYEFIFFKSPVRKRLLFLLPVLLTLIIVPLSVLHGDKPLGEMLSDVSEKTKVQTGMSRWEYLVTEMRVIVTYIRLIFLPINQNLDYDYPLYHSLVTPSVFLSFLVLLAIFGLGVYLLIRGMKNNPPSHAVPYRLIGFGVLWFFITLSVESSIIPIVDVIFEHRLYLPLVGVSMAVTTGAVIAAKRLRMERIVIPALVFVSLLLSGVTYARNALWGDKMSFWQDVVEKSPNKARPHYNFGLAYSSHGQWDRAITEYQTALRLKPDYAKAHTNLGVAYSSQGQWDRAIAEYKAALGLKPDDAMAHNNLG
ncbi:MAG TPA: tetratricopeptide repeat-containing protein, partial [Nitrospiraceae bacterium]|nr:tetratricopeptide repeat-containing protein [Nitrospiraceae bacterium]